MLQRYILVLLLTTLGTVSISATLNSFCHVAPSEKTPIKGDHIDTKLPIASVSKLITSYWSLMSLGKDHRFVTTVFYKKNVDATFDVHVQGGSDPYFGKEFLHLMISELNQRSIYKVRELSFDENFKFVWNVNSYATAIGDYTPESPTPIEVIKQFSKVKNLTTDYSKTVRSAKAQGITLALNARLSVKKFKYQAFTEFQAGGHSYFILKSSPLVNLLKEMNRNSNNYAANVIFESIGGAKGFKYFIERRLKFSTDDIELFNGSGNRLTIDGNGNYNSAKCSVVLKILIDFDNILNAQKLKFEDVVSVVGADNTSSTSRLYKNKVTENSVIAKTGTVSPAISLAGTISTKKGDVYFMYNMKTNGTRKDWRVAQRKIKQKMTLLIQNTYNGGVPISYQSIKFFPFDKESDEEAEIVHSPSPNYGATSQMGLDHKNRRLDF